MLIERITGRISRFRDLRQGMEFIATADAASDATIDFTAFNPSRFDAYLFVLSNVTPVTDAVTFHFLTSGDGGSTFDTGASNYSRNLITRDDGDANDVVSSRGGTATEIALTGVVTMGSAAGEDGFSGILTLSGPHLAKRTQTEWQGTYEDSNGNHRYASGAGVRITSADVNAVRFLMSSGNIESGTITMYGLRNS